MIVMTYCSFKMGHNNFQLDKKSRTRCNIDLPFAGVPCLGQMPSPPNPLVQQTSFHCLIHGNKVGVKVGLPERLP